MHKRIKGFTLIELLAVITVIGILATLAAVGVANASKRARDARRESDMRTIKQGLEQYNQDNGQYPGTTAALVPTYMATVPTDPKTAAAYGYGVAATFD